MVESETDEIETRELNRFVGLLPTTTPLNSSILLTTPSSRIEPSMTATFPSEVWADVLFYAAGPGAEREGMNDGERADLRDTRLAVVGVCRGWKVSRFSRDSVEAWWSGLMDGTSAICLTLQSREGLEKGGRVGRRGFVRTTSPPRVTNVPSISSGMPSSRNALWSMFLAVKLTLSPFRAFVLRRSELPSSSSTPRRSSPPRPPSSTSRLPSTWPTHDGTTFDDPLTPSQARTFASSTSHAFVRPQEPLTTTTSRTSPGCSTPSSATSSQSYLSSSRLFFLRGTQEEALSLEEATSSEPSRQRRVAAS